MENPADVYVTMITAGIQSTWTWSRQRRKPSFEHDFTTVLEDRFIFAESVLHSCVHQDHCESEPNKNMCAYTVAIAIVISNAFVAIIILLYIAIYR